MSDKPLTDAEITEALALADRAAPGPWCVPREHGTERLCLGTDNKSLAVSLEDGTLDDFTFMRRAREGWPRALRELQAARAEIAPWRKSAEQRELEALAKLAVSEAGAAQLRAALYAYKRAVLGVATADEMEILREALALDVGRAMAKAFEKMHEALVEVRQWRQAGVGLVPHPSIDPGTLGDRIDAALAAADKLGGGR